MSYFCFMALPHGQSWLGQEKASDYRIWNWKKARETAVSFQVAGGGTCNLGTSSKCIFPLMHEKVKKANPQRGGKKA